MHTGAECRKFFLKIIEEINIGTSYIRPLQIGRLQTVHNLVLAPLAGISNYPFRQICREFGANLTFSEMVSVDGLRYENRTTRQLLQIHPGERPVGFQLFGTDPEIFRWVIPQIGVWQPDVIDLNFGCPVRKVVAKGAGAALLRDLSRLENIVAVVKSVSPVPVTAKIRIGWDANDIVVEDAARAVQAGGADAITVHARTRSQGYSGKASWEHIARVKDILKIPVIGNGDVFDALSAEAMFRQTGADGIMLARGVLGRPWLFQHILGYLQGGVRQDDPPPARRLEVLRRHYWLEVKHFGAHQALAQMRKNFVWYTRGLPHSARLRDHIFRCENFREIEEIFNQYLTEQSAAHPDLFPAGNVNGQTGSIFGEQLPKI